MLSDSPCRMLPARQPVPGTSDRRRTSTHYACHLHSITASAPVPDGMLLPPLHADAARYNSHDLQRQHAVRFSEAGLETDEALADCGAHRGRELLAVILVDRIADTAVDLF